MMACSLVSPSALTECADMAWDSTCSWESKFSWQSGQVTHRFDSSSA